MSVRGPDGKVVVVFTRLGRLERLYRSTSRMVVAQARSTAIERLV